jgi:hypothetical protein
VVCESQITFDSSRGPVDQLDVLGRLTRGALDLLVTLVTDQQDVVVVAGEALRLLVHLGDQRTGGVDGVQTARGGRSVHRGRHAVRGEHHDRALGDLVGLVHEDHAAVAQRLHHVAVVHDLLAYVDRRAVLVQRLLDGFDRAVHAGAVPAWFREQHAFSALGKGVSDACRARDSDVQGNGRRHAHRIRADRDHATSGSCPSHPRRSRCVRAANWAGEPAVAELPTRRGECLGHSRRDLRLFSAL